METTMNNRLLNLTKGDLLELADARGTTLRVTRGTLWVTQERDQRDVVLGAGDTWTIERHGLTVGEAQGDAAVVVIGSGLVEAAVRSRRLRWQDRLAHWLERAAERHLRRDWVPHV
jgi:Protein of unknown function (DUF2917)